MYKYPAIATTSRALPLPMPVLVPVPVPPPESRPVPANAFICTLSLASAHIACTSMFVQHMFVEMHPVYFYSGHHRVPSSLLSSYRLRLLYCIMSHILPISLNSVYKLLLTSAVLLAVRFEALLSFPLYSAHLSADSRYARSSLAIPSH